MPILKLQPSQKPEKNRKPEPRHKPTLNQKSQPNQKPIPPFPLFSLDDPASQPTLEFGEADAQNDASLLR